VFFLLLSPIMWFGHTAFLVGLVFGRAIGWIGQTREDHAVPFWLALRQLWPQTLLGLSALVLLALTAPAAIPYALLIAGGLALAVPFAVLTATPWLGLALTRIGLGRLPEETEASALAALALPVLATTASRALAGGEATQCSSV
jgi:membrane glycosyltransferase